ncbi:hypothetical protein LNP04_05400 [Chryseobacterium sp. C-71]|uniref:hypothetical protein n=1 Tax=Chryseobacterium sp. C-71 TaxID=2893882 RepID=UPI001E4CAFA5|nr:hypothetical protein [Chryseobacterium sp. C-71]UFH33153.1 hypothetical protein LNP04_05400 [Chryseobacterium sp. C-71]
MATRDVIEKKINEISDGGNNSAAEMRDVLTDLLNYTENTDVNVQLPLFEFWEEGALLSEKGTGNLWYSFRGIEKASVNFTFRLIIREANVTNFIFRIDPKISGTLNSFFQQYDDALMSFVVAVTDSGKKLNRVWMMSFQFREDMLRIMLKKENTTQDRIQAEDEVFTSIQFHCPSFNFGKR